MQVTREELRKILEQDFNWQVENVEILGYTTNGIYQKIFVQILKHPLKKLYYYNGTFGKQYRVYKKHQIDITHVYYSLAYAKYYEYNQVMGTLTLDDFLCINLR